MSLIKRKIEQFEDWFFETVKVVTICYGVFIVYYIPYCIIVLLIELSK